MQYPAAKNRSRRKSSIVSKKSLRLPWNIDVDAVLRRNVDQPLFVLRCYRGRIKRCVGGRPTCFEKEVVEPCGCGQEQHSTDVGSDIP